MSRFPTWIAIILIGVSAAASQPFVVEVNVSVSGNARPIIRGTTNLPDGTVLWIRLRRLWAPNGRERLAVGLPACDPDCLPLTATKEYLGIGDKVAVKHGQFTDGPFTDNGADLKPGNYVLEVETGSPIMNQPPSVTAIIGKRGENMMGPLVGACCFGYDEAEDEAWLDETRRKLARLTRLTGATIYYARYVHIDPLSRHDIRETAAAPQSTAPLPVQGSLEFSQLPKEVRHRAIEIRKSCSEAAEFKLYVMQGIDILSLKDGSRIIVVDNEGLCGGHFAGVNCSNRGCDMVIYKETSKGRWHKIFDEHLYAKYLVIDWEHMRLQMMVASIWAGDPRCRPNPRIDYTSGMSCNLIVTYKNNKWNWQPIR